MKKRILFLLYFLFIHISADSMIQQTTDFQTYGLENEYEKIVEKCLNIWATVDLIKAIDIDEKGIYHYCNQMIDDVLILYAKVYNYFQTNEFKALDDQSSNYILGLISEVKKNCSEVIYASPSNIAQLYFANIAFAINLIFEKINLYCINFAKS
ncbi:hypothetical protein M1446_02525 [Candidatus Dependentiae bacterium]|nr:hypothetical protein [Candidatus Dependentiae bacterium]